MPIKTTSGLRCLKHQIECTYNCGWCGKSICEECVAVANGKKYCDKCWTKKNQMRGGEELDTPRSTGPRQPIKNVDTTIDPKIVEQHRQSNEVIKKKLF